MGSPIGKPRPRYTAEFQAEAIRLVLEQGYSMKEAARSLGMSYTTMRNWIYAWQKHNPKTLAPAAPRLALEEEVRRLRAENQRLRQERDILKKAAAFFAQEAT
jgi:transposase